MKHSSKVNQEILGKRLRSDAGKWDSEPSPASSHQTLRSIRKIFREPQWAGRPSLVPVFAAAMALVLIIGIANMLKPPTADHQPIQQVQVATNNLDIPRVPTPGNFLTILPDSIYEQEINALQDNILDTVEFLLGFVPELES